MTDAALMTEWEDAARELAGFLSELCSPPSNEPTETWAEKHVMVQDGPFAGSNWRLHFTPFARCIFAAMRDPTVRRVTIMMSAQYVKTTAIIIDFLRNASEDPSDTMWVMAEADHIGEFAEKRMIPYIRDCDTLAPKYLGKARALLKFEGMSLLMRGSNSRAKLQSDPVRRIYCDERREWAKGAIDLIRKRTRTFPNSMEISAGTPGEENDDLHIDYKTGSQTRGHIRCPRCQASQPIRFGRDATGIYPTPRECGGFYWETNEVTKPGGVWNYAELRKTVYFECENPACRARFTNNDKYELLRTMHPHDYNPTAPAEIKSFGGSAFEAVWESCDWDKLVEEFLKAVEEARGGNTEPLKAFITETLGEPWKDELGVMNDFGFLELRKGNYDYGEAWPEGRRRFMAADKQEKGGEHYPWVVREFAPGGRSRLVAHGVARTLAELESVRKEYRVAVGDAVIDSGYNAQEVYRFCMATGWRPFKGDEQEFYLVTKPDPRNPNVMLTVRQIWRMTKAVVYNAQTKAKVGEIKLITFCDGSMKDFLAEFLNGLIGEWTVPRDVAKEYLKQIAGEKRCMATDKKGRVSYFWKRTGDNHFLDCEKQILGAAIGSKVIAAPGQVMKRETPAPPA